MRGMTIALAMVVAFAGSAMAAGTGGWITHVDLPGDGRGDYLTVDETARRLYVTHGGAVHILDLDSLRPLAQVSGLGKSHGVALANGRGFVTDGGTGDVVMFDVTTGTVIKRIAAGKGPDCITYDPASRMIFAFNGGSHDVTVIDPVAGAAVRTIALGDSPEFAQADGAGKLWVNLSESATIAEIDSRTMAIDRRWKLPDCEDSAALAFDRADRRLFASCGNGRMKVVDADDGHVVASLPIGDADGISYDADRKFAYAANRDGTLTVVARKGKDIYAVAETRKTEPYAKTLAIDGRTHRLFSSTADLIWPKPVPGKAMRPDTAPGTFRLLVIPGTPAATRR